MIDLELRTGDTIVSLLIQSLNEQAGKGVIHEL